MEKKSTKESRVKIGHWVKIRKVGINGVYQIIGYDEHGRITVEQKDGGYSHKMTISIEDIIQ